MEPRDTPQKPEVNEKLDTETGKIVILEDLKTREELEKRWAENIAEELKFGLEGLTGE